MITRDEIARSLYGAWQLFLDRPNAADNFDSSYSGFWRSFQAIILVAPLSLFMSLALFRNLSAYAPDAETLDAGTFFWAQIVSLGLDWITLPILLALISGLIMITRTYTAYVVARNWSAVLVAGMFALFGAIEFAFGPLPEVVAMTLSLLVLAAALRLSYLVARRVMEAQIGLAIAVVVLDFLLSMFINTSVNRLFGMAVAV